MSMSTNFFVVTFEGDHTHRDSEALHYAAYWTVGGVLEIGFRHGGIYRYFNVPLQTAAELLTAESRGRFYNDTIRGRFSVQSASVTRRVRPA